MKAPHIRACMGSSRPAGRTHPRPPADPVSERAGTTRLRAARLARQAERRRWANRERTAKQQAAVNGRKHHVTVRVRRGAGPRPANAWLIARSDQDPLTRVSPREQRNRQRNSWQQTQDREYHGTRTLPSTGSRRQAGCDSRADMPRGASRNPPGVRSLCSCGPRAPARRCASDAPRRCFPQPRERVGNLARRLETWYRNWYRDEQF